MQLHAETIWNLTEEELISLLRTGSFSNIAKEIRFYVPGFTYYKTKYYRSYPDSFPTISVTGNSCSLNCKHCGGKVLETMHAVNSDKALFDLCLKLKQQGAKGCLISGGCLPDGSVPIEKFIDSIEKIKRELSLTVFVHTGVLNLQTAVVLKKAKIDAVLIDVIGSTETILKTCNLSLTLQDYVDSMKALDKAGVNFVPHVIVGLNDGKLDGELTALKAIRLVKPSALVVIAFMPIHGTAMEKISPPKSIDVAKVLSIARLMFPEIPLTLGCMRPKGLLRSELDILALNAGVDAIAFPSEQAVKYAQRRGWQTSFSSSCCAKIFLDARAVTK